MFEPFRAAFPPGKSGETQPFSNAALMDCPGFTELASECAGTAFGDGIVRVHSGASARRASGLIAEAFPDFPEEFQAIAQDWMGRQFAVGAQPGMRYYQQVLLFEPASGEAFEIDSDIPSLLNTEFVSDPVTYLAADLFADWRLAGGPSVEPNECVGFRVPLFLGGEGSVENLEIMDLEVYWSLVGQLRSGTRELPPGSSITEIWIDRSK
jgi:hypothetical protein